MRRISRKITRAFVAASVALPALVGVGAVAQHASAAVVVTAQDGTTYALSGVNVARVADALVAYTRTATQTVSPANQWGTEVTVVNGTVTSISDRQSTGAAATVLPANGLVLSGHGAARLWLIAHVPAGSRITVPGLTAAKPTATVPGGPGTITAGGSSSPLAGVDVDRAADTLVAYTRTATQTASPANIWGAEAAVVGGKVTSLVDRQTTGGPGLAIPSGGYVLSGHGSARLWLLAHAATGTTVTYSPTTVPPTPPTPPTTPASGLPAKVVAEYWRTDSSPRLVSANPAVNVFLLSFAKSAAAGTGRLAFNPDEGSGVSSAQMKADISTVRARGASVVLSIGGSVDGGITMTTPTQVAELVASVNSICDTYGCTGIDWDLEHGGSGTNLTSLVAASAQLKASRGNGFTVSASVEPGLGLYEQFAVATGTATVGGRTFSGPVCDLYGPQFYDYPSTVADRQAGIVANARKMVSLGLPPSRYAIGTTYAGSALGASGEMSPSDYLAAYRTLASTGTVVRGAYVWDMTIDGRNGYPFATTFGPAL